MPQHDPVRTVITVLSDDFSLAGEKAATALRDQAVAAALEMNARVKVLDAPAGMGSALIECPVDVMTALQEKFPGVAVRPEGRLSAHPPSRNLKRPRFK